MSRQIGHFRFPDASDESNVHDQAVHSSDTDHPSNSVQAPGKQPIDTADRDPQPSSRRALHVSAVVLGLVLVLLLVSFSPYYGSDQLPQSVSDACRSLHGSDYQTCKHETLGDTKASSGLHWNAWGSWLSWPAIVLFLIIAAVIAFKAVFSKSEKVVLSRQVKLGLVLADLLFLVSVFHIPHDNAGRAWGLWLSLVCVIGINVGILLSTTEVGEWIAERWPKRVKLAVPPTPAQRPGTPQHADYRPTPQAMPPGHRQPNWPPPAGQQQVPSNQFPPNDLR